MAGKPMKDRMHVVLTVADVRRVRALSAAGASRVDINKQFPQVTYWTIRAITTDRSRLHAY